MPLRGDSAGTATAIIAAARAAVGIPFRAHGRDAHGLDCVGLAALALRAGGYAGEVPGGYALRRGDGARVTALIDGCGLVRGCGAAGELLLFASGPGQLHLAIATETGIVHADALLRRVVERPGVAPWPIVAAWRVREGGEA